MNVHRAEFCIWSCFPERTRRVLRADVVSRSWHCSLLLVGVWLALVLAEPPVVRGQLNFDRNSMEKIRVTPGKQASRIGTAVDWQPDFETAIAKSKETGKPVFWYVPTLKGSFMDRKNEIDRYMMAGPFSWPDIISVLNEHYVPLKATPTLQQQQAFQIVPYVFIEPGFVILDVNGDVTRKVDRMTTLHPEWIRRLLTASVLQPIKPKRRPQPLEDAWAKFEQGRYEDIDLAGLGLTDPNSDSAHAAESLLLAGMVEFRRGDHRAALLNWRQASQIQPDHPLAWKAAAEAEGFGPFMRGFEIHRTIPAAALQAGIDSPGSAAPKGIYSESDVWNRGIDFLLAMQNQKGGYTDSDYDFGGTDSLPNVHVAVTSLAGMALLEAESRLPNDDPRQPRIESAINRAAQFVSNDENLNKFDRDELLWAFAYRVRFLARLAKQDATLQPTLQKMARDLEMLQGKTGAWFHEYSNPFVTATALLALKEASEVGAEVSNSVVDRGVTSLAGERYGNGAFPYASSRRQNAPKGPGDQRQIAQSAGRMPLCELGLAVWEKSSDQAVAEAIQRSFDLNENLMVALKYDDHTSRLSYGGFFFWYDIRGRSEAIARLKDPEQKAGFAKQQRALILSLPELDGCFVDSHELGRVYGTSMALLSLANLDLAQE